MSTVNTQEIDAEEELYHLQESTNEDGTVDVEIEGWEKIEGTHSEKVAVEYVLPSIEREVESMDWPEKATDDYKFVRLVRHCGYSLAGADQIEGSTVRLDGDELVIPEKKSVKEKSFEFFQDILDRLSTFDRPVTQFIWGLCTLYIVTTFFILDNVEADLLKSILPAYIGIPYIAITIIGSLIGILISISLLFEKAEN